MVAGVRKVVLFASFTEVVLIQQQLNPLEPRANLCYILRHPLGAVWTMALASNQKRVNVRLTCFTL